MLFILTLTNPMPILCVLPSSSTTVMADEVSLSLLTADSDSEMGSGPQ